MMDQAPKSTWSWKATLFCAMGAAALTALFAAASLAIPRALEEFARRDFAKTIRRSDVAQLIRTRRRLDEVRDYLDRQIEAKAGGLSVYALRAQLHAVEESPQAGFHFLTETLRNVLMREDVVLFLEMARLAVLAERWDDFFELSMLLNDYGESRFLRELLTRSGVAGRQAMASPEGLHFIAHAGWDRQYPPSFTPEQERLARTFRLWELERDLRLGDTPSAGALDQGLIGEFPGDLRVKYLSAWLDESRDGPAARLAALPTTDCLRLLAPTDFTREGKPLANGNWVWRGRYEGLLPPDKPAEEVWLVAAGTPVLQVFPLLFVELDDELSIRYLHHDRLFPMLLRRRDRRPFQRIALTLVNDFISESLGQDRNVIVLGIYSVPRPAPPVAPARNQDKRGEEG
jgi:hypothetical protein